MPTQLIGFNGAYVYGGNGSKINEIAIQTAALAWEFGPDPNHRYDLRVDDEAFSPYWPGRSSLYGEALPLLVAPASHAQFGLIAGGNGCLGFSGVTRDGNNSPVGGMTVRLYRTSDSLLVQTVVSRADGSYNISTPYVGQDHFIACYKTDPPAKGGASLSNLQPW